MGWETTGRRGAGILGRVVGGGASEGEGDGEVVGGIGRPKAGGWAPSGTGGGLKPSILFPGDLKSHRLLENRDLRVGSFKATERIFVGGRFFTETNRIYP